MDLEASLIYWAYNPGTDKVMYKIPITKATIHQYCHLERNPSMYSIITPIIAIQMEKPRHIPIISTFGLSQENGIAKDNPIIATSVQPRTFRNIFIP